MHSKLTSCMTSNEQIEWNKKTRKNNSVVAQSRAIVEARKIEGTSAQRQGIKIMKADRVGSKTPARPLRVSIGEQISANKHIGNPKEFFGKLFKGK